MCRTEGVIAARTGVRMRSLEQITTGCTLGGIISADLAITPGAVSNVFATEAASTLVTRLFVSRATRCLTHRTVNSVVRA